ncbi:cysteine hydrolase family protein [Acetobacter sp.]|jgi:nicotinamidase-related amidase|uniref:cysteine hydrolase family protein n=1 Tax=Acetobacter sp. TaxID=440 RepID=UPI0025BFFE23|nr:isochorismatase family cysteine hydrolase [Acetobacter sp.]MCH4092328.1 cysteine hydrolase [Acetobacter sp.]MCI1300996.1 cysteine hydrolase [Acetobacter sp.]MCI1317232.1 cysteine hydrolase [Acetobacter sp.]
MSAAKQITAQPMIVGRPALVVIDIQKGCFAPRPASSRLEFMSDAVERYTRARKMVDAARVADIPVIFVQEAHRSNLIDFGRELDGSENIHCLEGDLVTEFAVEELGMLADDYRITKRRYSVFFGTDMEILLKGLRVQTLVMVGGFTDVCVHYSFVDAHQMDYYCRVVEDCVAGSSYRAHEAALSAMEYLQAGARRNAQDVMAAFSVIGHGA